MDQRVQAIRRQHAGRRLKNSGLGREKGIDGLRLYAQVKSMCFGLHEQPLAVAR